MRTPITDPRCCGLGGDPFHGRRLDALQRREVGPLLVVGVRVELSSRKTEFPALGPVLERQRDEVSEAAARHRVLARKQPIVGVHAELVPP